MRLFINREKVFDGKPERIHFRIESDEGEQTGPCKVEFTKHLTFNGTGGEAAISIDYGEGLTANAGLPSSFLGPITATSMHDYLPEPEYVRRID